LDSVRKTEKLKSKEI